MQFSLNTLSWDSQVLAIEEMLALLFIVIVFISEILFIGLLNFFDIGLPSEIGKQGINRIIGMVGTKIIYFWIVIFVCRLINRKIKEIPIKQWITIVLMPAISTIILYIIYYDLMSSRENNKIILYCIAVLGLLYINYAVFDFFETYLKQLRVSVLEQVIERETTNYKQLENAYNDMRTLKHDVANQLDVITDLITRNDKESAEAVIRSISMQLENVNAVCYTGEPIIDSVINIKLKYAHELGINIAKRIKVAAFNLDKIELCRAIGNVLDNAIEGCQRSGLSERHIYISIQQLDDKIVVEITNNATDVDLNNLQTSKKNKSAHGIGLSSIQSSVEKLNGYMKYDFKNSIFSLKMVVPNK